MEPGDGVVGEALLYFVGVDIEGVLSSDFDFGLGGLFGDGLLFLEDLGDVFLNDDHFVFEFLFDEGVQNGVFAVAVDVPVVLIFYFI